MEEIDRFLFFPLVFGAIVTFAWLMIPRVQVSDWSCSRLFCLIPLLICSDCFFVFPYWWEALSGYCLQPYFFFCQCLLVCLVLPVLNGCILREGEGHELSLGPVQCLAAFKRHFRNVSNLSAMHCCIMSYLCGFCPGWGSLVFPCPWFFHFAQWFEVFCLTMTVA